MFFVEKACVLTLINPPWVDWMGTYDRSSNTLIFNFVRAAAGKGGFLGRRRGPFKNDMWVIFWNYSWYLSVAPAKSIVRSWSSLNRKHTNRLHIDSKDVATTNPSMDMSSPIDELWSFIERHWVEARGLRDVVSTVLPSWGIQDRIDNGEHK